MLGDGVASPRPGAVPKGHLWPGVAVKIREFVRWMVSALFHNRVSHMRQA